MSGVDPLAAGFRGAAARMQPADLAAEAAKGGFDLASLEAVLDVESAGSGFDSANRPKMLPERHIFYHRLTGPKRDQAVALGLAYPVWGSKPYPSTSEGCYQLLTAMCGIDPTAAMESASWGIAQVMGFNHAVCGYTSAQDMVTAAMGGESAQFDLLIQYVTHTGHLAADLRAKNWAGFALYNGPGNVAVYAGRLAAAYARHVGGVQPHVPPHPAAPVLRQAPTSLSTADLNDQEYLRVRLAAGS